jgi:predicted XRE-type DNA-binding protein
MKLDANNSSIYYKVQNQALHIGEKDLARIFDRARFDPRLMEVATEFIRDFWWNINPTLLNRTLKNAKFPFAVKPAIAAILQNSAFPNKETYLLFLTWYEAVVAGIKNPRPQLFYIGLNKIGSKSMRWEEEEAIPCFTNYNLIAKDIPFNKGRPGVVKNREQLLNQKFDEKKSVKSELALKIKSYKESNRLKNSELAEQLGINRTFISKILNNDLEHITVDYLMEKAAAIATRNV